MIPMDSDFRRNDELNSCILSTILLLGTIIGQT
jgi:hypothetical protein